MCVCVCQYRCVCVAQSLLPHGQGKRALVVMGIPCDKHTIEDGSIRCFLLIDKWSHTDVFYLDIPSLSLIHPLVFPPLKERLGDAKEQVREQCQQLIQQIFQNVVGSPQPFFDKLMDVCLVHKNWRVKEQGLLCLSRTLS